MPRLKSLKYDYLANRGYEAWKRDAPKVMAVDTETEGTAFYDRPFCATVAWDTGDGVQTHYFELADFDGAKDILAEMLAETPTLTFHNAKFDLQKLILESVLDRDRLSSERIEDTECLWHLTNEHTPKKLKFLARLLLDEETDEEEALNKAIKKAGLRKKDPDFGYHLLPRAVVYPYALKDAEFTLRLWQELRSQIAGEVEALYGREMELCLVLLDMEAAGMVVDIPYVKSQIKKYSGEILREELVIEELTGLKVWYPEKQGQKTPEGCINPNSHVQIKAVFLDRGIELANTQAATFEAMNDPLATAFSKARALKKIRDTYLRAMLKEQRDGIIHPNYRQHGAKTGRMSSGKAEDG